MWIATSGVLYVVEILGLMWGCLFDFFARLEFFVISINLR